MGITAAAALMLLAGAIAVYYILMRRKGSVKGSFLASLVGQQAVSDGDTDNSENNDLEAQHVQHRMHDNVRPPPPPEIYSSI